MNISRNGLAALLSPIVITTLATLSGCSAGATLDYTTTIDPSFTSDQIESLSAGISEWTAAVPELQLTQTIGDCSNPGPQQVCIHPAYDAPDPVDDVIGTTDPGPSSNATIWIYVNRIEQTGWDVGALTEQTMAHEIGHAVGLKHSGSGQLMAANVPDQAHTVTQADIAQFWAVRSQ